MQVVANAPLTVLVVLVVLGGVLASPRFIQIDNTTKFFVDDTGSVRIFHGVNAVFKEAPWHPDPVGFDSQNSLSAQDAQNLRNWGMNVVRLGVEWPGVEPAQGQFNETYLDVIEQIVDTLGEHGILSILDCHQDLFSRFFCGEGVPDWAVPHTSKLPFPLPARKELLPRQNGTKYPDIEACLEYYLSGAVASAFQDLYENTNGLQDLFAEYWKKVATRFRNNPHVLGFELLNEPFCGDIYEDPSLLVPGKADRELIMPMYENLHEVIREIDDEHIIFFDPAFSDAVFKSGFEQGPGGPEYNDRQAYSYHIYCGPTDGEGDPTNMRLCNFTDTWMYRNRVDDYERMGVGAMMTEFGAMLGTEEGVQSLNFVLNAADEYIQGWAYWNFKHYEDITTVSSDGGESFYLSDGSMDEPKIRALCRTYAPSICGIPSVHRFNPLNGTFQMTYNLLENATCSSTQVYFNKEFYYPTGVMVTVNPPDAATFSVDAPFITLQHTGAASGNVSVVVEPLSAKRRREVPHALVAEW